MANNRGIVSGWDTDNARPKGVTSPAMMRTSLASIARTEGLMLEVGAAKVTREATRMALTWTAFTAVISSPLGGWLCPRIDAQTFDLAVGDATYPRVDVIYVRQWDYQVAGDHPDSEVEVGVVNGTPSATPTTPATPAGALAVFTVTVPKGAVLASDIPAASIKRCRWTTPMGGVLSAATLTEANALVAGIPASEAAPLFVVIGGVMSQWNGKKWDDGVVRKSQTAVTGEKGYSYSPDLVIHHYGAQHTMPICVRWDAGAWTATDNRSWRVAVVPSGVAVPTVDYMPVGTLNVQGMAHSLAYLTSTREIIAVPGSKQSVSAGRWMYGTASWIA